MSTCGACANIGQSKAVIKIRLVVVCKFLPSIGMMPEFAMQSPQFCSVFRKRVHLLQITLLLFITINFLSVASAQKVLFPTIKAETLAGNEITFPNILNGKKGIIVVAFQRQAQAQADSWYNAYTDSLQKNNYIFYEIPMISSFWKWMSGWIDAGMRSGVPSYKHNNVATYYGPLDNYYTLFDVKDKSLVYVFTVDVNGYITGKASGPYTPAKLKKLTGAP